MLCNVPPLKPFQSTGYSPRPFVNKPNQLLNVFEAKFGVKLHPKEVIDSK